VVTELVKGKTVEDASKLTAANILAVLGGLPEENLHCAALAVDTLNAAIVDYRKTYTFLNHSISGRVLISQKSIYNPYFHRKY